MSIVLALVTLASAALSLILLWPHGALLALVLTPFVTSLSVLVAAAVIMRIVPGKKTSPSSQLIDFLNRLLPR